MTVYAVFKEGVYRHACAGVFSTEEKARDVADARLAAGDGYHSWDVVPFELDMPCPPTNQDNVAEPSAVYVAKREQGRR